jgi:hypothetical protein
VALTYDVRAAVPALQRAAAGRLAKLGWVHIKKKRFRSGFNRV